MNINSIEIAEIKTGYLINAMDGVYHYDNSTDAFRAIVNLLDESTFTVVSEKDEFDQLAKTATSALELIAKLDCILTPCLDPIISNEDILTSIGQAVDMIKGWPKPRIS